jgi:hypothetical protein
MAAVDNKTLRTACANCGTEIPTDVDADVKQRKTWPLLGETAGKPAVFPACTKCYNDGWRPPGYAD